MGCSHPWIPSAENSVLCIVDAQLILLNKLIHLDHITIFGVENKVTICKKTSFLFIGVVISHCCCYKWPQIQWLKNNTYFLFYTSGGKKKSKMNLWGYKQGVSRTTFLLKTLGANPLLCFFQLLEADWIPWLVDTVYLQSQQSHYSDIFRHQVCSTLTPLPPSFTYKDPCDYIGPPR